MENENIGVKDITFSKGCDEWLIFKENTVKESSYLNYKFKIDKHLKPDLGNKSLYEISKYDMNEYINSKKKLAENTAFKDMVVILKSILRYLKKKYKIDFDLDFNSGSRNYVNDLEIFNEYERQKLVKYLLATNTVREIGILFGLYSGLRIGEVCGLKWEDIDFDNKLINIRRTVQRVYMGSKPSKVIISSPKTRKSIRKIPIARILFDKLKEFSKNYAKEDFVITRNVKKMYGTTCLQIYV